MTTDLTFYPVTLSPSGVRTETFNDREHLVVPVVMLIADMVVWGVNSPGPELVPADVLSAAPEAWNGRPVVAGHPNDGRDSANTPNNLEQSFGLLFNTVFSDGRLSSETWLDTEKAKELGGEPLNAVERLQSNETVEVSIGAFVARREESGSRRGRKYTAVWISLKPDHLALLKEDEIGACSVDSGCGALRTMKDNSLSIADYFAVGREVSHNDLRDTLWAALNLEVPGLDYLVDILSDGDLGTVIYTTFNDNNSLKFWRRSFVIMSDVEVKLTGQSQEVTPTTRYSLVGGPEEEQEMVSENVKALVDCKNSPFDEGDIESLSKLSDDKITAMRDHFASCDKNTDNDNDTDTKSGVDSNRVDSADRVELKKKPKPTAEEWLQEAPEEVKRILAEHKAREEAERVSIVESLKDVDTLKGRLDSASIEELRLWKDLAKVDDNVESVDYSPVGARHKNRVVLDPYGLNTKS